MFCSDDASKGNGQRRFDQFGFQSFRKRRYLRIFMLIVLKFLLFSPVSMIWLQETEFFFFFFGIYIVVEFCSCEFLVG